MYIILMSLLVTSTHLLHLQRESEFLTVFGSGSRWTVKRRFSDFLNVAAWIKLVFPHVSLADLPSKMSTVFGSSDEVANNRRIPLQDWIQTVVSMDETFLTFEVGNFVGMYENLLHPRSAPQASGSVSPRQSRSPPMLKALVNFEPKPGTTKP